MLLASACGCSHLLYQPMRQEWISADKLPFRMEDAYFPSEDGTTLHGWYLHSDVTAKPKGVVVFFHGNGENMTTHFHSLVWLLDYEYDFFIFDYRGYGSSEGSPSPEGTLLDGRAAIRWVYHRAPALPLIVFGQSLGGAIALRSVIDIKNELPIRLVIVDSTFPSYISVARHILSHHTLTWLFQPLAWLLLSDKYAPDDRISEISPIPLVVMHGDMDQIVDFELGQKVFELAREPKEFWRVPGGTHISGLWRYYGKYRKLFLSKLDAVTGPNP